MLSGTFGGSGGYKTTSQAMGSLFQELKRRNVFRVGAAYLVVAWLIVQVIETISRPLSLPDWTEAFFIVLLLAGFPVILIFAWAFELTPEGLKKTSEVKAEESVTATTGKKLNFAIIAVLVMSLGYFVWERQSLVEQVEKTASNDTAEIVETEGTASVAVLPFVNMSADPEQEYFSDGISEELLNLLAKIPEIRVPARTSSFQFKGQNLDISDVAKQLNVRHVLEGSVRKADVRVRVTAQLIEADTGYHLWSETYDRELDDIFAIQDEISAAIVDALSETLGLQARAAPKVAHASNSEAYNSFLFAQHLIKKRTKQDIESAIPNYERALVLDPDYAPAHAGLGLAWYLLTDSGGTYGDLPLEVSLGRAMPHIERALELDPELPEALGVMGLILSTKRRDTEALPYFEKALALNPSLTDVHNWYSQSLSELGRRDEAFEQIERAYHADPLSVLTLHNYTNELLLRRRFDSAGPILERLEMVDAGRAALFRGLALVNQKRAAEGMAHMLRVLGDKPDDLFLRQYVAELLWNFDLEWPAESLWPWPDNLLPLVSGSSDFDYVLELAQKRFNADPNNPSAIGQLAWANWRAGNEAEGLRLAERLLASLDEDSRQRELVNIMFALDALKRGDMATVEARVAPLDAEWSGSIAAGIEVDLLYYGRAAIALLRGDRGAALAFLEQSLERGYVSDSRFARLFERHGLNDDPHFVALRARSNEYIRAEKQKLLTVACGSDGFDVWQPSPEDCGRNAKAGVPN